MEKIKFVVLPTVMVLFALSSCSDDDFRPEEIFQSALMGKYPDATRVEWEKKKIYVVADCIVEGKDADVWFSKNAEWKMTEIDILKNELPAAVTTSLAGSIYDTWRIDDVDLLKFPSKADEYVVEIEQGAKEILLYYSAGGELLREKDVSNSDDTNWPEE